jgi:DNA repair protein RecO (recombination protein O)
VSQLRDDGVVLRTYRLGEADRIVVAMTAEHGKVRAVAKGVRRTGSKFGARLEPMSHVALMLWKGRGELMTVNQVEVIEHHWHLREDLDRLTAAMGMLEVVDQIAQEDHEDRAVFETLVKALRTMNDPTRDPALIAPAFFLRILELEGAAPLLDACASCGADDVELVAFDLTEGGALCRSCRRGRPLSPEALGLVRRILGGDLGSVLTGPPPPGATEVSELATAAMEGHLDRRLRAVRSVAGL